MCGRYYYDDYMWADLLETFPEVRAMIPKGFHAPGDITPAMPALALAEARSAAREAASVARTLAPVKLTWGFPGRGGKLIINARAESITERPTFADSVRERRCVMPAAGFYEWDGNRQKVSFTLPERPVLYLAGIWRTYEGKDGPEQRFVVITREANESMRPVHDRMPLMIAAKDVREWVCRPERAEDFLKQPLPQLHAEREYEQTTLF